MLLVSYEINGGHLYLFYHTSTFFSVTIDKCPLSGPILHHFWLLLLYPTAHFSKIVLKKLFFKFIFVIFSLPLFFLRFLKPLEKLQPCFHVLEYTRGAELG